MTLRAIFEGIGEFFEWAFGLLEFLGSGFNGIGFFNVFWMLVITVMVLYWLNQMRLHRKHGEH